MRCLVLIVVGSMLLAVAPAQADATKAPDAPTQSFRGDKDAMHPYSVWCRPNHHHPWRLYGVYYSLDEARHVAHDLEHLGYEAYVE